jgi:hypothetical protein
VSPTKKLDTQLKGKIRREGDAEIYLKEILEYRSQSAEDRD